MADNKQSISLWLSDQFRALRKAFYGMQSIDPTTMWVSTLTEEGGANALQSEEYLRVLRYFLKLEGFDGRTEKFHEAQANFYDLMRFDYSSRIYEEFKDDEYIKTGLEKVLHDDTLLERIKEIYSKYESVLEAGYQYNTPAAMMNSMFAASDNLPQIFTKLMAEHPDNEVLSIMTDLAELQTKNYTASILKSPELLEEGQDSYVPLYRIGEFSAFGALVGKPASEVLKDLETVSAVFKPMFQRSSEKEIADGMALLKKLAGNISDFTGMPPEASWIFAVKGAFEAAFKPSNLAERLSDPTKQEYWMPNKSPEFSKEELSKIFTEQMSFDTLNATIYKKMGDTEATFEEKAEKVQSVNEIMSLAGRFFNEIKEDLRSLSNQDQLNTDSFLPRYIDARYGSAFTKELDAYKSVITSAMLTSIRDVYSTKGFNARDELYSLQQVLHEEDRFNGLMAMLEVTANHDFNQKNPLLQEFAKSTQKITSKVQLNSILEAFKSFKNFVPETPNVLDQKQEKLLEELKTKVEERVKSFETSTVKGSGYSKDLENKYAAKNIKSVKDAEGLLGQEGMLVVNKAHLFHDEQVMQFAAEYSAIQKLLDPYFYQGKSNTLLFGLAVKNILDGTSYASISSQQEEEKAIKKMLSTPIAEIIAFYNSGNTAPADGLQIKTIASKYVNTLPLPDRHTSDALRPVLAELVKVISPWVLSKYPSMFKSDLAMLSPAVMLDEARKVLNLPEHDDVRSLIYDQISNTNPLLLDSLLSHAIVTSLESGQIIMPLDALGRVEEIEKTMYSTMRASSAISYGLRSSASDEELDALGHLLEQRVLDSKGAPDITHLLKPINTASNEMLMQISLMMPSGLPSYQFISDRVQKSLVNILSTNEPISALLRKVLSSTAAGPDHALKMLAKIADIALVFSSMLSSNARAFEAIVAHGSDPDAVNRAREKAFQMEKQLSEFWTGWINKLQNSEFTLEAGFDEISSFVEGRTYLSQAITAGDLQAAGVKKSQFEYQETELVGTQSRTASGRDSYTALTNGIINSLPHNPDTYAEVLDVKTQSVHHGGKKNKGVKKAFKGGGGGGHDENTVTVTYNVYRTVTKLNEAGYYSEKTTQFITPLIKTLEEVQGIASRMISGNDELISYAATNRPMIVSDIFHNLKDMQSRMLAESMASFNGTLNVFSSKIQLDGTILVYETEVMDYLRLLKEKELAVDVGSVNQLAEMALKGITDEKQAKLDIITTQEALAKKIPIEYREAIITGLSGVSDMITRIEKLLNSNLIHGENYNRFSNILSILRVKKEYGSDLLKNYVKTPQNQEKIRLASSELNNLTEATRSELDAAFYDLDDQVKPGAAKDFPTSEAILKFLESRSASNKVGLAVGLDEARNANVDALSFRTKLESLTTENLNKEVVNLFDWMLPALANTLESLSDVNTKESEVSKAAVQKFFNSIVTFFNMPEDLMLDPMQSQTEIEQMVQKVKESIRSAVMKLTHPDQGRSMISFVANIVRDVGMMSQQIMKSEDDHIKTIISSLESRFQSTIASSKILSDIVEDVFTSSSKIASGELINNFLNNSKKATAALGAHFDKLNESLIEDEAAFQNAMSNPAVMEYFDDGKRFQLISELNNQRSSILKQKQIAKDKLARLIHKQATQNSGMISDISSHSMPQEDIDIFYKDARESKPWDATPLNKEEMQLMLRGHGFKVVNNIMQQMSSYVDQMYLPQEQAIAQKVEMLNSSAEMKQKYRKEAQFDRSNASIENLKKLNEFVSSISREVGPRPDPKEPKGPVSGHLIAEGIVGNNDGYMSEGAGSIRERLKADRERQMSNSYELSANTLSALLKGKAGINEIIESAQKLAESGAAASDLGASLRNKLKTQMMESGYSDVEKERFNNLLSFIDPTKPTNLTSPRA